MRSTHLLAHIQRHLDHDSFDQDHGTVHDNAEIDSPERNEVGGNIQRIYQDKGKQ